MVEVEGIEPSSRDGKTRTSTHIAWLLKFICCSPPGRSHNRLAEFSFTLLSSAKSKASSAFLTP